MKLIYQSRVLLDDVREDFFEQYSFSINPMYGIFSGKNNFLSKTKITFYHKLFLSCFFFFASLFANGQIFDVQAVGKPYGGASGNGIDDDYDNIASTIEYAHQWSLNNNNALATVKFPSPVNGTSIYLIKTIPNNVSDRHKNYVFMFYSNMKFLGSTTGTSVIKFDSGLFSATSGGNLALGTGMYTNANLFYALNGSLNGYNFPIVANVTFTYLTIDFNGINNLLPPGQTNLSDNTGVFKTIFGIYVEGASTNSNISIDHLIFKNNPGRNDITILAPGFGLNITNCTFENGGRNIGSVTSQNSNSYDFSFIYSEWDSAAFTSNTIEQDYPEVSLQDISASGGIEIHGSNSYVTSNYIYGCKPALFITSSKDGLSANYDKDGEAMKNVQVLNNQFIDCWGGIQFWVKNYIDGVTIDGNQITTMLSKITSSFVQNLGTNAVISGISIPAGNSECTFDYDYWLPVDVLANPNHQNLNLKPLNNINITNNTISFDISSSSVIPTCNNYSSVKLNTIGIELHSLQNSTVSGNTINNMNYTGVLLKGSRWGTNNLKIINNNVSDFQYNYTTNLSGYVVAADYYKPNSDCNPTQHLPTFRNISITGNTFTSNNVVVAEFQSCPGNPPPTQCSLCDKFRDLVFDIPAWYGYTTTAGVNTLRSEAFNISNNIANPTANLIATSACTSNCLDATARPSNIHWYDILANSATVIEEETDNEQNSISPSCQRSPDNADKCNIGYRLLATGGNNHKWVIDYTNGISNYPTVIKYGNPVIITRGIEYPLLNETNGKITIKAYTRTNSNTDVDYLQEERLANVSCFDPSCSTACNSSIELGTALDYSTPLTQSQTYITANTGTVTIKSTANVRFDANGAIASPNQSFIQIAPIGDNYFLAAPGTDLAMFVAQPLDGCGDLVVSRPAPVIKRLSIYPNPATISFNISSDDNLLQSLLQVFDLSGKLQNIRIENLTENTVTINCSNLSKGLYLVKINFKNKIQVRKIVII